MEEIGFTSSRSEGAQAVTAAVVAPDLHADAIVFKGDSSARLERFGVADRASGDVLIATEMTGISAGTEKLFWSGAMPPFPGMAYPLVPGYETVGRVIQADPGSDLIGKRVFVAGSYGLKNVSCLFGGAASHLVVPAEKAHLVEHLQTEDALLLSLAATAHHAIAGGSPPDLIVGFGALGRLLFRLAVALGHRPPTVWETNPDRAQAEGINARTAETDATNAYRSIYDVSGSRDMIDGLIGALQPRGSLVLAGFYPGRIDFAFAPAFQKEAQIRIAAEWSPSDMQAVLALTRSGKLSLSGLVSHVEPWRAAASAYHTAFNDPSCLKMGLDWRSPSD